MTVIELSGTTSLLTDGTHYFLQPNGGAAVELSYSGSPVDGRRVWRLDADRGAADGDRL